MCDWIHFISQISIHLRRWVDGRCMFYQYMFVRRRSYFQVDHRFTRGYLNFQYSLMFTLTDTCLVKFVMGTKSVFVVQVSIFLKRWTQLRFWRICSNNWARMLLGKPRFAAGFPSAIKIIATICWDSNGILPMDTFLHTDINNWEKNLNLGRN